MDCNVIDGTEWDGVQSKVKVLFEVKINQDRIWSCSQSLSLLSVSLSQRLDVLAM